MVFVCVNTTRNKLYGSKFYIGFPIKIDEVCSHKKDGRSEREREKMCVCSNRIRAHTSIVYVCICYQVIAHCFFLSIESKLDRSNSET